MRRVVVVVLILAVLIGVMSFFGFGPVVINSEGEQRVALLLGDPVAEITEPGIHLVPPFVNVLAFDGRWQHLAAGANLIQTLDQERIVIDHYVIWRIHDPLEFRRAFPTGMDEAAKQIDQQVRGAVREVIGRHTLTQILKDERALLMGTIAKDSGGAVERLGVEIGDVRINRTELPRGTEENVFARMRAERDRLARKYRAEGEEEARRIRALSDRDARVIVAKAEAAAAATEGQGDAEAAAIYAEAFGRDPEFYAFVRGLEAYRSTIGEGTTMVLPPDHPFFALFLSGGELPEVPEESLSSPSFGSP
jgi:membrane protease subunit HflC